MKRLLPALTCLVVLVACGGESVDNAVGPDPGISPDANRGLFQRLAERDTQIAETQMSSFATAIHMYYMRHRQLPTSLAVLTEEDPKAGEAYMDSIPNDPWGNAYDVDLLGGKEFRIVSYGQDGQEGTEDDVVWPRDEE